MCLSLKYQEVKKHIQLLKIRAKSLCPPQIPLGLALDWIQASAAYCSKHGRALLSRRIPASMLITVNHTEVRWYKWITANWKSLPGSGGLQLVPSNGRHALWFCWWLYWFHSHIYTIQCGRQWSATCTPPPTSERNMFLHFEHLSWSNIIVKSIVSVNIPTLYLACRRADLYPLEPCSAGLLALLSGPLLTAAFCIRLFKATELSRTAWPQLPTYNV